jgi:sugar lactone lactonase YvrE
MRDGVLLIIEMLISRDLPTNILAALMVSAAALFIACAAPTPTSNLPPSVSESPSAPHILSPSPLLSASPFPSPEVSPSLPILGTPTSAQAALSPPAVSASPSLLHTPRLLVLAENLAEPDDLVLSPDHSIYFSDVGNGSVNRLESNGSVTRIVSGLKEPEGLVFLPDGSIVIAEQVTNRLLQFDPRTKRLSTFLQLENRTGRAGVDGILFDPKTLNLIVPDSPNGTLLRVSLDAKIVQVFASGFARPTGADIASDGSILVADENGNAVYRVAAAGGSPQLVARLPVPDDLTIDASGNIYINTMGDGAIHFLDVFGKDRILWRGLNQPQGIILDEGGNLLITDSGNHRIVKLILK